MTEADAVQANERSQRMERARGLMLGLLLGDCVDEWRTGDSMHGSATTQLACFTLEGLIRAHRRGVQRGICHVEGVIWRAWCRWAHIQGLGAQFASCVGPYGWLHQVRPLSVRRDSAPATVRALLASVEFPDPAPENVGATAGHHALTRALPLAILMQEMPSLPDVAMNLARCTHGSPAAWQAAASGVRIVAAAVSGQDAKERPSPGDQPGTAPNALWYGWRAVDESSDFAAAVNAARRRGEGPAVVAGALYGARFGASALDGRLLGRHEIAWVADQLARDAIREVTEGPGGSEFVQPSDPLWSCRYPGG